MFPDEEIEYIEPDNALKKNVVLIIGRIIKFVAI